MDLNFNYFITKEARISLAEPSGDLLVGTIEENISKVPEWFKQKKETIGNSDKPIKIICVGDVVSEAFINCKEISEYLKMCIVDGQTKRKKYNIETSDILPNKIIIDNPAGQISGKASEHLKSLLYDKNKYIIEVIGEEDLLVIPLAIFAEKNTFIVYGQPPITDLKDPIPAGMVILEINHQIKEKIINILKEFRKEPIL